MKNATFDGISCCIRILSGHHHRRVYVYKWHMVRVHDWLICINHHGDPLSDALSQILRTVATADGLKSLSLSERFLQFLTFYLLNFLHFIKVYL